MKSLSLDSPESTELHGQIRRRYPPPGTSSMHYPSGSGGGLEHTPPSNNSRLHCNYCGESVRFTRTWVNLLLLFPAAPSSPSAHRKLLSANRNIRTGSVDLPDDMEKSLSSASTSPCPSPVRQVQVPNALLLFGYFFKIGNSFDNITEEFCETCRFCKLNTNTTDIVIVLIGWNFKIEIVAQNYGNVFNNHKFTRIFFIYNSFKF